MAKIMLIITRTIVVQTAVISGAWTNLKVGRGCTGRRKSGGHRSGAKHRKKFFGRAPPLFWL